VGCGWIGACGRCCGMWSGSRVSSGKVAGGSGGGERYVGCEEVMIGDEVGFL
jgi:hypothetical protein